MPLGTLTLPNLMLAIIQPLWGYLIPSGVCQLGLYEFDIFKRIRYFGTETSRIHLYHKKRNEIKSDEFDIFKGFGISAFDIDT
jgi:hypothetical protein